MKKTLLILIIICAGLYTLFLKNIQPPKGVVYPVSVVYNQNENLITFADELHKKGIITSPSLFRSVLVALGYDRKIKPNEYVFTQPLNIFFVAQKIGMDASKAKGIRVVIPEGSTVSEIKTIVHKAFPLFETQDKTSPFKNEEEGYLFPDTYYFSINSTEEMIVEKLKETFDAKTEKFKKDSERVNKDFSQAIIMASILEKEGKTFEERKMISGILWKRIKLGMPLQVDATFLYTNNKGSSELSISDIQKDNEYNTYTRKGLPKGPINNPGVETIEAALFPEESPYLFYLHDKNGQIHYGKNFEEHKRNKEKYLY